MKAIPIYDATAPITCTIGADEIADRVALLERLRAQLRGVERSDHGLLLRFPPRPDVEADVRRFAVEEKRCCRFWGFAVEAGGEDLVLRWDAPPAAGELLERIRAAVEGDAPITGIAGLL